MDAKVVLSSSRNLAQQALAEPVWDFIEPAFMGFPQLYVEIGLVNNVLNNFYSFIDDHVEAPPDEEKYSRDSYIMANVVLTKSVEKLNR
jgi:hypothetical protein